MKTGNDSGSRGADRRRIGANRRQFLSTVAASMGLVAGCLDGYGDAEKGNTDDVWVTALPGRIDDFDPINPNTPFGRFAFDIGFVSGSPTDDPKFVLAADVKETPSSISLTLKPDLNWSNGDPLTTAGIGRWAYMYRMGAGHLTPVPKIHDGISRPRTAWEAITDIRWEDRVITVEGDFDEAPSPLFDLNTYLGSRPRAYYDQLWEAFQDAYDEEPWENDESQAAITKLVEDNIWYLSQEYRPDSGIHIEDEYDGTGQEAAFSGLWYPARIEDGHLDCTVNDAHPFADRVAFNGVRFEFQGERASPIPALRSGAVDGIRLDDDVTETLLESVPPYIDSFDGAPRGVISMTVNHLVSALGQRDVRAALMYAIDRDVLVESLNPIMRRSIAVPGADLQTVEWLPPELRDAMRSYEYNLDRARTLLERAGFQHTDEWKTPDGDAFEIEILTDNRGLTIQHSIADQLSSFGIDTNIKVLESTSYQTHLEENTFIATDGRWPLPNAAGRRYTRAGDYVRPIVTGNGFQHSSFLERETEAAIEQHHELSWARRGHSPGLGALSLEFDEVDDLRSITVEAPPLGEPNEPVREWPYLYHAVRAACTPDIDKKIEHARICTWIYNYVLPELELLIKVPRIFHDTDHWSVPPVNDLIWDQIGDRRHPGDLWAALGWGHIDRA